MVFTNGSKEWGSLVDITDGVSDHATVYIVRSYATNEDKAQL